MSFDVKLARRALLSAFAVATLSTCRTLPRDEVTLPVPDDQTVRLSFGNATATLQNESGVCALRDTSDPSRFFVLALKNGPTTLPMLQKYDIAWVTNHQALAVIRPWGEVVDPQGHEIIGEVVPLMLEGGRATLFVCKMAEAGLRAYLDGDSMDEEFEVDPRDLGLAPTQPPPAMPPGRPWRGPKPNTDPQTI